MSAKRVTPGNGDSQAKSPWKGERLMDAVFANRVAYVKSDKLVRRSMDEYEARKYRKAMKKGEANFVKYI